MTGQKFGDLPVDTVTVPHDAPLPSLPSSTGHSSSANLDAPPSILMVLHSSTDRLWHKSKLESLPASTLGPATVPTKERTSESCMSEFCTQTGYHGGAMPVQLLTQYQDVSAHSVTSLAIMMICSYLSISVAE
jgi:hypothetical protein